MENQINNVNITDLEIGDIVIIKNLPENPAAKVVSIYISENNTKVVTERIENDSIKTEIHYLHNLQYETHYYELISGVEISAMFSNKKLYKEFGKLVYEFLDQHFLNNLQRHNSDICQSQKI